MDTVLHDLRVAARSLSARPGFSLVAVLTLALGVGATTALFSVVHGILLRALPFEAPERVVVMWQTSRRDPSSTSSTSVSHVNYRDWKRDARSFESMALFSGASFSVTSLGEAEVVTGALVTTDFFKVFHASPVIGREFTAEEDRPNAPRVVVVSHGFWKDRLGARPDVIGSTIEAGGRQMQIVGVAPPGFEYPDGARMWATVANDDATCGRACVYLTAVGRLAGTVPLESARREMDDLARRLEQQFPEANTDVAIGMHSLRKEIVGEVERPLWLLLGAVAMVLLIACANVANLLLVRGTARQGELAVRSALGASGARMLRFLLAESFVLALAGAASGLLLAWWGVDILKGLAPTNIPRLDQIRFDAITFGFAAALATSTALLFGLGPAIHLARAPVSSLLGARGGSAGRFTQRGRSTLLVAEVALSLMLLAGAGLLVRSMMRLSAVSLGWDSTDVTVFTIGLPAARYPQMPDVIRTFEHIDERLAGIPGTESVARISGLPLGPNINVLSFTRPDRPPPPPGQEPSTLYRVVDTEYFKTVRIPLLAGRQFDGSDRQGATPVAIISRELAGDIWNDEDPIGKQVQFGSVTRTIVGVVGGVRSTNIEEPPQAELYVPHAQSNTRGTTFVIRSSQPTGQVISAAREIIRGADSRLPLLRPGAFAELEDRQLARPRFYLVLLSLFAVLAVALAAVGIYGVVAYAVSQRTREIGVRMALGAEAREVVRLVMWQGLKPAALGVVLGTVGALSAARVIERLLYQLAPRDPMTIWFVVVLLLAIVAIACAVPAWRATKIPPASALRAE